MTSSCPPAMDNAGKKLHVLLVMIRKFYWIRTWTS